MKILIVVDMQKDFIDGSLGTKEAQAIVGNVIKKIEEFDGYVVYTRDTHYEDYLKTQEGKKLPVEHCIVNTDGWKIPKDIFFPGTDREQTELGIIYNKSTFGSEQLALDIRRLRDRHINEKMEIELVGLCTDICVVSNALLLKAMMPEVTISVDASCCAGVTPETHEAALKTMKMCQIDVHNWNDNK